MNSLLFRRLRPQYMRMALSSQNKSFISYQMLRHLNNFDEKQNYCLNGWQTMTTRMITTSPEFTKLLTNRLNDTFLQQKRFKKAKKASKKSMKDESSDEDSDEDSEPMDEFDADLIDGKAIGFQDVNASIVSLRLDNVMKSGLNMARTRVDEAFYGHLIRVNGQRVAKKSVELVEGDEVDLIKGFNKDNQDMLDISRVVIKSIEDKMSSKDRVPVKLRRFRSLTIENYANDPYDGFAINVKKEEEFK